MKLLIICGPTATGKTDLGIKLAEKYNGEIISADSRQVYKGLDIITGKDIDRNSEFTPIQSGQNSELNINNSRFDVGYRLKNDIPVWLVDIVEPEYMFNVGEYSRFAHQVIKYIWSRNKLPIIVGGSGLYVKAIVEPLDAVIISPDKLLRNKYGGKDAVFLQRKLEKIDPEKLAIMNQSDRNNPRRLIRALEIALWKKKHPDQPSKMGGIGKENVLVIGLKSSSWSMLFEKIDRRVNKRIENGAVEEVKNLLNRDFSWLLPAASAAGLRELKDYLEGRLTLHEAAQHWGYREHEYARNQMGWFRKQKNINWFDIIDPGFADKIEEKVEKWYTSN